MKERLRRKFCFPKNCQNPLFFGPGGVISSFLFPPPPSSPPTIFLRPTKNSHMQPARLRPPNFPPFPSQTPIQTPSRLPTFVQRPQRKSFQQAIISRVCAISDDMNTSMSRDGEEMITLWVLRFFWEGGLGRIGLD